jgi:hypothetical protein
MLKCLGAQYTRKLNLAIKYRNIFKQSVCPDIAEKTLKSAKSLQNKRWTNHITHHNYSFSSTQSNFPVTLLIYNVSSNPTSSSDSMENYQVELRNDSTKAWFENIKCAYGWTLSTDWTPSCHHAAFCLCYPNIIYDPNIIQQTQGEFKFDMKKWYSEVYHVDSLMRQYEAVVHLPSFEDLPKFKVFPPLILKRAGRKKLSTNITTVTSRKCRCCM